MRQDERRQRCARKNGARWRTREEGRSGETRGDEGYERGRKMKEEILRSGRKTAEEDRDGRMGLRRSDRGMETEGMERGSRRKGVPKAIRVSKADS